MKQYCLVIESGTIAKAASLLHISPGALSRSMQRLRTDVKLDLFVPHGRNIHATEQGLKFYQIAKDTIEKFTDSLNHLHQKTTPLEELRIGSYEVFTTYVLEDLLNNELKGMSVTVLELTPGAIEVALLNRQIDLGITYAPVPLPGLIVERIASFKMATFTMEKSPLRNLPVSKLPFAEPTTSIPRSPINIESFDAWPSHAFRRHVQFRFELLETSLMAARSGHCAIHIPEFIAVLANRLGTKLTKLDFATPKPAVKLDAYVVRRIDTSEDRRSKKFCAGLRRVIAMRVS